MKRNQIKRNTCILLLASLMLCSCARQKGADSHPDGKSQTESQDASAEPQEEKLTESQDMGAESPEEERTKKVIQATVTDLTGVERQLKMDIVENEEGSSWLKSHSLAMEYSQVSEGHYYYLRQVGMKEFTIYRDFGEKVGDFKLTWDEEWKEWHGIECRGIVKYGSQFYVEVANSHYNSSVLAVVDLEEQETKKICEFSNPTPGILFHGDEMYAYYIEDASYIIEKLDKTGEMIESYFLPEPAKNEDVEFIDIADGKIYYSLRRYEGKKRWEGKYEVSFRYLDMESKQDKEIFCYQPNVTEDSYGSDFFVTEDAFYCVERGVNFNDYDERGKYVYYFPLEGGEMKRVGDGIIGDFTYNDQYFFYIDTKHRLHQENRKTGKDKVVGDIKFSEVTSTDEGLYLIKYDPWYLDDWGEHANYDYSSALYFMDFAGNKFQQIEKRKLGHLDWN